MRYKRMQDRLNVVLFLMALTIAGGTATAQNNYNTATGQHNNYISTGMPILQIAPDAISGAMGDAGVASVPDVYSSHWNNAKFAFVPNEWSVSTTYTPWLHKLAQDMNFLYVGGYKRINKRSAFGASLTYFSLGSIEHYDDQGHFQGEFVPNEFAFDATYAMRLSENLSLGATARYMRSDLTQGMDVEDQTTKAANGLAADVGLYWEQTVDDNQTAAAGLFISNLGSKLSYSDDDTQREFLPANLRLGGRYTYEIDEYNKVTGLLDLNKLLVPTPPDGEGDSPYANMTEYNNTSAMEGVFRSFFDAPGGIGEELREITLSLGGEYWYANTFAARAGYFYEHSTKGGRQYLTLGVGVRYNVFNIDFSYLVPTSNFSSNPLANTIRISLTMNMAKGKK